MAWLDKFRFNAAPKPAVNAFSVQEADILLDRLNSLVSQKLGIGLNESDPLESLTVSEKPLFGQMARDQYRNLDVVQRIIDAPGKDALKNGFRLKTNYDNVVDLGNLLYEKMCALEYKKHFEQFVINYGIYQRGAVLFPVIQEREMDPNREHLSKRLRPKNVERIEGLNVVREDLFFYIIQSYDPLARDFEKPEHFTIGGQTVHRSRFAWSVDSLDSVRQYGVTQLQRIITACRGLNIAEWTIVSLLIRYRAAILSYPSNEAAQIATKEKKLALAELLNKIKMNFTSKSLAAIPNNYEMKYFETTFTGIKEACEYLWDYLAAVSHEPQSIIKGSAQGELASARNDRQTWNGRVKALYQNSLLEPAFQFLFPFLLWERQGECFEACQKFGINPDDVKVTVEWASLDVPDPMETAQIENMVAQTVVLLKQNQLITPQEAQRKLNPDKDDFALESDFDPATPGNDPLGLFAQTKANMPDVWKKLQEVIKQPAA